MVAVVGGGDLRPRKRLEDDFEEVRQQESQLSRNHSDKNHAACHPLRWDSDVFLDHEWAMGPTRVLVTAAPATGTRLHVRGSTVGLPDTVLG